MVPLFVSTPPAPNGMWPAAVGSMFQSAFASMVTLPPTEGPVPKIELPGTTVLLSPINLI